MLDETLLNFSSSVLFKTWVQTSVKLLPSHLRNLYSLQMICHRYFICSLIQDRSTNCKQGRDDNLLECSSRFQKNAGPLGAPQPPNNDDRSQNEASKSSSTTTSQDKASSNDQKPPDEAKKTKELTFTDVLFITDVDKAKVNRITNMH